MARSHPAQARSCCVLPPPYDTGRSDWADQWCLDQEGACIDAGSGVVQPNEIDLDTFTTSLDGKLEFSGPTTGQSRKAKITHSNGEMAGIVFTVVSDESGPTGFAVKFPKAGSTVTGY
jgi:hypothetical protein